MIGKKHRPAAAPGVNLAAIVTPFLDMAFQILAFFIMTYHPSAFEGHIAGSLALPRASAGPAVPSSDAVPDPGDLAETTVVRIARGTADGAPGQILVKRQTDAAFRPVVEAEQALAPGLVRLEAHLRDIARANPLDADVRIEIDGALRQQYVMQVYDACRKAGFARVGFVPPALHQ